MPIFSWLFFSFWLGAIIEFKCFIIWWILDFVFQNYFYISLSLSLFYKIKRIFKIYDIESLFQIHNFLIKIARCIKFGIKFNFLIFWIFEIHSEIFDSLRYMLHLCLVKPFNTFSILPKSKILFFILCIISS